MTIQCLFSELIDKPIQCEKCDSLDVRRVFNSSNIIKDNVNKDSKEIKIKKAIEEKKENIRSMKEDFRKDWD